MIDDLYSARILTLAANMPRAGRLGAPQGAAAQGSAEKVAKLCGSRIVVDVILDGDGRISDFAQDVQACALGQAAAAVLGENVIGADENEIETARDAFRAMLKEGGPPPQGRFKDLAVLMPVQDYPARHASSLLAFEAALAAVQAARSTMPPRTSKADAA
jgi:NifU-like protein involved in Fe-S cluster formation